MVLYACSAVVNGVCENPEALQVYFLSGAMASSSTIVAGLATMICVAGGFNLLGKFTQR